MSKRQQQHGPAGRESGYPYRVAPPVAPDLAFLALRARLVRSARLRALPLGALALVFVAVGAALIWTPPRTVAETLFVLAFVGDVLFAAGGVLLLASFGIALAAGRQAEA